MYSLYTHTNDLCENYDSVELAIIDVIKGWHESETPCAYTVRDENDLIMATICPIGSDAATVVYAHGDLDRYTEITYPGNDTTQYRYNGGDYVIEMWN